MRTSARAIDNAACEGCHRDIADEWRQSLHHTSFSDSDFQRSFALEPSAFCHDCHAPERGAAGEAMGVGCITCHVPSGSVPLAAPAKDTESDAGAPHAALRLDAFATQAACASCHEFLFPDAQLRSSPLAMQRTVSEAAGRGERCASCHMSKRGGHADHRFAASRDPGMVKSAVTVTALRVAPTVVEITLTPAREGHAFPTGDLFRRVRVTAGASERFLTRHYVTRQERPGIMLRTEVSDDRVLGTPRVVRLEVPQAVTRVRVVYERAEGPSDPASARTRVFGSVELYAADL